MSRQSKWRFRRKADAVLLTGEDSDTSSAGSENSASPKRPRHADGGESSPSSEADDVGQDHEPEDALVIARDEAEPNDEDLGEAGQTDHQQEDDNLNENEENGVGDDQAEEREVGDIEREGIDSAEDVSSDSEREESESEGEVESEEEEGDEEENEGDRGQNQEQAENEDRGDRPLYNGARLSVGESLLAIMTFVVTHALTGNAMLDLLHLIALHCPEDNTCVKSLHTFWKYFKGVGKTVLKCHFYCARCCRPLISKNTQCTECAAVNHGVSYFIEVPLLAQLQTFFKRPGFCNDLQFRFTRVKKFQNNIEDLFDGSLYKQHEDFFRNPNNISFMWYSDGVSVFNWAKKFSIWPLFLVINELGYKNRVKRENIILAGIWFGKRKPKVNTFLAPFHSELEKLYRDGYLLEVADGPPILVKGMVLCGTCDMPAKSTFLRITQFNGNFGCPRCMQKGEAWENNNLIHVYPFVPNVPSRSNEDVERYARVAVASGHPCYGIRGLSILYHMVPNMILSTGIDFMHGVFSGVGKLVTGLLFDRCYEEEDFSLHHLVNNADSRLSSIRVPSFLNKFPLGVSDLTPWKSLDFKVWLLYYSVPVLLGLMPDQYMEHHMLLVSGIYLLSQRSISLEQIDRAERLLQLYVSKFQNLYGLRWMGINIHQLLHLAEVVRQLGPSWVYSCYFLEDLNGKILKYIHGTSYVGKQVATTATIMQQLSSLINLVNEESPVRKYCENLHKVGRQYKVAENIAPGVFVVGKFSSLPSPPWRILLEQMNIRGGRCQLFARLWRKGVFYLSESYTRAAKRESSFVLFTNHDNETCLGSIRYFIRWSNCNCVKNCLCNPCQFICVIHVYERKAWKVHEHPDNVSLAYMNAVDPSEADAVVPISNVNALCFHLKVREEEFVVERVNDLEAE